MKERWSDYLKDFVPKWRHTPGWERFNEWRRPEPVEGYRRLATDSGFHVLLSKVLKQGIGDSWCCFGRCTITVHVAFLFHESG